jgi:hypothetical protein
MANGLPSGPPGAPQVVIPGAGWVDVVLRAITTVGFPVVVACALLWFVLARFQATVELISGRMAHTTQVAEELIEVQSREISELEKQTSEMQQQTATLRAIADKLERRLGQHEGKGTP